MKPPIEIEIVEESREPISGWVTHAVTHDGIRIGQISVTNYEDPDFDDSFIAVADGGAIEFDTMNEASAFFHGYAQARGELMSRMRLLEAMPEAILTFTFPPGANVGDEISFRNELSGVRVLRVTSGSPHGSIDVGPKAGKLILPEGFEEA